MADASETVKALEWQARQHDALGAHFGAEFLRRTARDAETGGPVAALLSPWAAADEARQRIDAAPIRLLGAFNDLVLEGAEPELTALSPPRTMAPEWDRLWPLTVVVAERRAARLAAFMTHEPQTNEVRRCMALVGGFLTLAAETGLPLRCFELGASAGLNLNWDRFGYRFGASGVAARWGDLDSPLQLDAAWEGAPPPLPADLRVIERAGCDRRPTRLDDAAERRRLEAYVWPDQPDRLARLRAAAEVFLASGLRVEPADAGAFAQAHLAPQPGAATVVYHSVFWQYPTPETRARITAAIDAAGAAATSEAPFAWLRMEPSRAPPHDMEIRLTTWPGGEERLLGHTHPHGASVRWAV